MSDRPQGPASAGAPRDWVADPVEDDFLTLVGPLWRPVDQEFGRYGFRAAQKHMNRFGSVHGGMLLTVADRALGLAAWEAAGRPLIATVQLDTKFICKVRLGDFVEMRCEVVRRTSSLVFMSGTLAVGEDKVGMSSAVYKYR